METDRPHRSNSINNSSSSNNSTTSELFICFTSRLSSSSSMKIPSKSLLSPGRAREGSQISLSNSLSRRLRSSGSMKGQASPMFPTNGKKRGCSFENPEPSSPKVTCIGQVRVKTKKQGNKIRARSKRGVDVSFRRLEQSNNSNASNGVVEVGNNNNNNENMQEFKEEGLSQHQQRNQRWVDLPVTICEALRTFGAELNCFLPCRSSCMASEKVKEEGSNSGNNCSNKENSSCGAVFRWLVAVDGEGKGREIELVVGEEEEEGGGGRRRSYRRHVFDEMEFGEEKVEKDNSEEEESGRVSICIPPKNALLLMRCRSDPVKMAALSNKFWEPTLPNDEEVEVEQEEDNVEVVVEEKVENGCVQVEEKEEKMVVLAEEEVLENQEKLVVEKSLSCQEQEVSQVGEYNDEDFEESRADIDGNVEAEKEEVETPVIVTSLEEAAEGVVLADPGNEDEDMVQLQEFQHIHQEQQNTESITEDIHQVVTVLPIQTEQESEVTVTQTLPNQEPEPNEEPEPAEPVSLESLLVQEEEQTPKEEEQEAEETVIEEKPDRIIQEGQTGRKSTERESQAMLPDCLLLMMCEPKLSMEVSKETWVCSTDFIRWLPEHSRPPVNKKNGGDEPKKRISIDVNPPPVHRNNNDGSNNVLQQPPRSSCSYPAKPPPRAGGAQSMATAIEQKLVNSKGFEPFVLTRCKSEPMRTAAKLAPEPCFWKNRKLEPHRPATVGIGAAGVGF